MPNFGQSKPIFTQVDSGKNRLILANGGKRGEGLTGRQRAVRDGLALGRQSGKAVAGRGGELAGVGPTEWRGDWTGQLVETRAWGVGGER